MPWNRHFSLCSQVWFGIKIVLVWHSLIGVSNHSEYFSVLHLFVVLGLHEVLWWTLHVSSVVIWVLVISSQSVQSKVFLPGPHSFFVTVKLNSFQTKSQTCQVTSSQSSLPAHTYHEFENISSYWVWVHTILIKQQLRISISETMSYLFSIFVRFPQCYTVLLCFVSTNWNLFSMYFCYFYLFTFIDGKNPGYIFRFGVLNWYPFQFTFFIWVHIAF